MTVPPEFEKPPVSDHVLPSDVQFGAASRVLPAVVARDLPRADGPLARR